MRRLRRATALLVSFLLAQLTLAGTSSQCRALGLGAGRIDESASAAHATMEMAATPRSNDTSARAGDCSDCDPRPSRDSCSLPESAGAPCAQMTSCAAPIMVLGPVSALEPSRGSSEAFAAKVPLPPGLTPAPEPPPPRE